MSNLDVALRLRLINGLKAGATDAKRDLAGVKAAAAGLASAKGAEALSRNLDKAGASARKAKSDFAGMGDAARAAGQARFGTALVASADKAGASARRARSDFIGMGDAARAVGQARFGTALVTSADQVGAAAQRAKVGLEQVANSRGARASIPNKITRELEATEARAARLERILFAIQSSRGPTALGGDLALVSARSADLARRTERVTSALAQERQQAARLRAELERLATSTRKTAQAGDALRRYRLPDGRAGRTAPDDRISAAVRRRAPDMAAATGAFAGRLGAGALGMGGGAYAVGAGAHKAVKTFADLETAAKDLGITADQTDATVAKSVAEFRSQAAKYGTTTKEIVEAAKVFVAAGLDYNTAIGAVIPTVKTAKASFGDLSETAKAGVASISNLGIKVEDLPEAFDRMAKAGKEGNVELKNLAKILPAVAASGSKLGLKGLSGLTDITAALEILGKVTATPDEAANRLENLFEKITADETVKNFKKVGKAMGKAVDLEKEIEAGAKRGETALAVVLRLTQELTKGNPFRINELFGDMQARAAVEGLLKFEGEYNGIRERINKSSRGMIDEDLTRATGRLAADFEKLGAAWDRLAGRIGEGLAPGVSAATKEMTAFLDRLEKGDTIIQRLVECTRGGDNEAGKADVETKLNGEGSFEKWFEDKFGFLSGQEWNDKIDAVIGKTGAEARALRERDGYRARAEDEARTEARPDELRDQITRRREVLERSRQRAEGAPGIQADMAKVQAGKSEAEIARLEGELAKAVAAVEALKEARAKEAAALEALKGRVQSLERTGSFGVDGVKEMGKVPPVGRGQDAFGFSLNGSRAKAVPLPPERPKEFKAEVKAEPQDLSGVGNQTMTTFEQAVKAGLVRTEAEIAASAARMKATLSFNASPTITPRISAPAGGGAAPASTTGSAPTIGSQRSAGLQRGGAEGGARTRTAGLRQGGDTVFNGPIHVHGVRDVASLHKGISREADRAARTARHNALHDTGNDFV